MRKWRILYRAIHNVYVPEYRDFLFWHKMDMRDDVDQYLKSMRIRKTTLCRDDYQYYWGFHSIDDAIYAIREYDRMNILKQKRKNETFYLTDTYKIKKK